MLGSLFHVSSPSLRCNNQIDHHRMSCVVVLRDPCFVVAVECLTRVDRDRVDGMTQSHKGK